MSNTQPDRTTSSRSWLERFIDALAGEPQDREQLLELLRDAKQRQLLDIDSFTMIEGVLQVSQMHVRDIMIPRSQMVVVDIDATLSQLLPIVVQSTHSRFPVIGENRDEVQGIILAKDLLKVQSMEDNSRFRVKDILRPAMHVPESKRLDVLLKEFRLKRNHMAIVVDEYGVVSGLVTIEDILEQIVGNIEDETDIKSDDNYIQRVNENRFLIKALTPIENFNTYFATEFSDEDYDTIAGLVIHGFGHLPKPGETLTLEGFQFTVLKADKRRIQLLEMVLAK